MALLLLLIYYAQIDGKMERNLDGWTKQYNNEHSSHILKCLFLLIYVLSMCYLCVVYVLSMCCLCVVFVLHMYCLCLVYFVSMSCLCIVYTPLIS